MDKYHHINHWDNVISVDSILNEYNEDKKNIIKLLETPQVLVKKLWHELLNIDHTCRYKMYKGDTDTEFICINCQNMNLIAPNKYTEPFKLLTGSRTGTEMIITEPPVTSTCLSYNNKSVIGDPFTLKILLTWYVEQIFTPLNVPYIKLYTGFICGKYGYLLYEAPLINNQLCNIDCLYDNVEKEILIENSYGLLCQFIVIYDILKNINFSLGHSNKFSFLFENKPCSYVYKNININCKYTVYLADLSYSSVKINNVQYSVDQCIGVVSNNKAYERKNNQYRIKDFVKHNLPLSIDFYLLLSSLAEDDYFIYIIKESTEAYALWKKLWVNYDEVLIKLKERYEEDSPYDELLKNIWLHDNPTDVLFS